LHRPNFGVTTHRSSVCAVAMVALISLTGPSPRWSEAATESLRPRASILAASPAVGERQRGSQLLVDVVRDLPIRVRPGGGDVVGLLPRGSRYFGTPITAWVEDVTPGGRFGRVSVPYSATRQSGWIRLRGLDRHETRVFVRVDLSRHWVTVRRGYRPLFGMRAATGAPSSPTPVGHYFVTDLVAFPVGGSYGSFAFGISGIQTSPPAGWTGGDQLAIHGTNEPWTIGASASAGCIRVSERALSRLRPILRLGTPVVIRA
jgi:lipoprotein-anchoring transpeptidase ErfK/SrfK